MPYNEDLANRVRAALGSLSGLTEKMSGGLALMLNGKIFVGVTNDDLMVRVGTKEHESLLALPHARPMDFTGRPMNGFVLSAWKGLKKQRAWRNGWAGGSASPKLCPRNKPARNMTASAGYAH